MWLFNIMKSGYVPVQMSDINNEMEFGKGITSLRRHSKSPWRSLCSLFFFGLLCLIIGFACGEMIQVNGFIAKLKASTQSSKCRSPTTRREWRSLSTYEKDGYINAVRCLLSKPSKVRPEGVLYDDFPYIHNQIGGYSHGAAAFLSWHRYLLHLYETELRTTCGYTGSLTYWDWSLDWEALANSPVFSNTTGFGGDGNPTAPNSVGNGHCVTDGPFSDLALPFFNSDDHIHCLSRGFADGDVHGRLPGDKVQPAAIDEILRQPDFESFFMKLEKGPHDQIPNGIRGDFIKFTAPNDPVFFLHHSQLDRLWWMWQQRDPLVRLSDYAGKARHGSEDRASLQDVLPMGKFAPDMHVSDVMNTETGFLCYRY